MANIRVTASVSFDYDTEDGLVSNVEEAVQDVRDMIIDGGLMPGDFDMSWETDDPELAWHDPAYKPGGCEDLDLDWED